MKAFQKIIYLSIFSFLLISAWYLLVEKPFFYQFTLDIYGFLAITKFIFPVLVYVCIYEKLVANRKIDLELLANDKFDIKKLVIYQKPFFISFGLVFVIGIITLFSAKFFGGPRAEFLEIFNPTTSPIYFMYMVVAFDMHKRTTPIPILRLNEKPIFYLKLFFFSILGICVFLLVIFALATLQFHHKLEVTSTRFITDCFLYAIIAVTIAFFTSFSINKIAFFRKSILFSIVFSTAITFWTIKLLGYPQDYFRVLITENVLLIITLFLCMIIISIPISRSKRALKIKKLTSDFSKKEAEYLQLKNQINPHFLFNNLNILVSFIELDPKKAVDFGIHLSNVYRHYLKNQTEDFVSLQGELDFITEYLAIYKAKFENGFTFTLPSTILENQYILSSCLQELVDNIFKHNNLEEENPLTLEIFIELNTLVIQNTINKKEVESSSNFGLNNIKKRYLLLTNSDIQITETKAHFKVTIPILELES
nr:histidine kinase [uncultured Flavobacterium sp.]